ncbi:MAG TPA: hypothetical protein VEZ11_02645, partial [Thermoanaerobaculia bacterium]|nr:hypothetical protein [Thermoanaerobaculia bacterium]
MSASTGSAAPSGFFATLRKLVPQTMGSTVALQLQAYAEAIVANLEANSEANRSAAVVAPIKAQIEKAIDDFRDHRIDELGFFLSVKALEYRVVAALAFDCRQLAWFVEHDLSLTPATCDDIATLKASFVSLANEDQAPDSRMLAKLTHVAISYWQRYADMMVRAVQRERNIALFLGFTLAAYLAPILFKGVQQLLHGVGLFEPWHWGEFVNWLASEETHSIVVFLSLGCAGAVVSMSLAGRQINATRPFDDRYTFWSSVPRLMIGAVAGSVAPSIMRALSAIITGNRAAE